LKQDANAGGMAMTAGIRTAPAGWDCGSTWANWNHNGRHVRTTIAG
jgi:hypothetical protein